MEIFFVREKGGEEKRRRTISPFHERGNFSWVAREREEEDDRDDEGRRGGRVMQNTVVKTLMPDQ